MGVADRILADRSKFFNVDDFAKAVSYTPSGAVRAQTINGIFDEAYELSAELAVEYGNTAPAILCKSSDVASAGDGDEFEIDSATYYLMRAEPDGAGMTLCVLSKDPLHGGE